MFAGVCVDSLEFRLERQVEAVVRGNDDPVDVVGETSVEARALLVAVYRVVGVDALHESVEALVDVIDHSDVNLGIVFQSYALFSHMSVLDNVAYPLKVRGMAPTERAARARNVLASVGLDTFAERSPRSLSGGQQQRVALARAIAFAPVALLLDEPLSALDASLRSAMRDEIVRVQRAAGIATIHVTHDQDDALSMADRIAVMQGGRLIQVATPHELYDRPCNAFVAGFVGEANLWPGTILSRTSISVPFGTLICDRTERSIGSAVEVLVRPERIRPAAEGEVDVNRFTGTVKRDRFLGAVRRYDLAIGGAVVTGETGSRAPINSIVIPPDAIRLLPKSDEALNDRSSPC